MNSYVYKQYFTLNQQDRSRIKQQLPLCLWFTGLSGSGKSTIANQLEQELIRLGKHTYILDGDNLRMGLNSDLDFSLSSRKENVRRAAEVARLMVDAGLIVIVGLISPLRSERSFARELFDPGQFKEIFISTSLDECERRDVKGLYEKARMGKIKDFTGIDSPYEEPLNPEITLNTELYGVSQCVELVLREIM